MKFTKEEDIEPNITGLEFYADAFKDLDTCRPVGMSVGAIPFTAIAEYFKIYPVGEFEEFHFVIKNMDAKFLELEHKKEKPNGRDTSKNNKSDSGRKGK